MSQKGFSYIVYILFIFLVFSGIVVGSSYIKKNIFNNYPQVSSKKQSVSNTTPASSSQESTVDSGSIILTARNNKYLLADNKTEIRLKSLHYTTVRDSPNGYPYLKLGDDWLEIIHKVVVYQNGYLFTLINNGCEYKQVSHGDYYSSELSSCEINITSKIQENPSAVIPARYEKKVTLVDLNGGNVWDKSGIFSRKQGDNFYTIRFLGYYMGSMDESKKPWLPLSISSGFDIITNYGVANFELGYNDRPIIGFNQEKTLGPYKIKFIINDVGNTNTHCYTGSCINVFDMDLIINPLSSEAIIPVILEYE